MRALSERRSSHFRQSRLISKRKRDNAPTLPGSRSSCRARVASARAARVARRRADGGTFGTTDDPLHRPPEAIAGRLPLHHPAASSRSRPVVGEPQEVEAPRTRRAAVSSRPFGGGNREAGSWSGGESGRTAKPLRQYRPHPASILLLREDHDRVVGEANHESTALQPRLHVSFEPHVQGVMKVDVRQKR